MALVTRRAASIKAHKVRAIAHLTPKSIDFCGFFFSQITNKIIFFSPISFAKLVKLSELRRPWFFRAIYGF